MTENKLSVEAISDKWDTTTGYFAYGFFAPQEFLDAVVQEDETATESSSFTLDRVRYGFQKTTYDDPNDPEIEYFQAASAGEEGSYPVTIISISDCGSVAYGFTDTEKWYPWEQVTPPAIAAEDLVSIISGKRSVDKHNPRDLATLGGDPSM